MDESMFAHFIPISGTVKSFEIKIIFVVSKKRTDLNGHGQSIIHGSQVSLEFSPQPCFTRDY